MSRPNINRMAHKANSLGETMPVAELYASSVIKTKKHTGKNRKLCRKDLKDEGKGYSQQEVYTCLAGTQSAW